MTSRYDHGSQNLWRLFVCRDFGHLLCSFRNGLTLTRIRYLCFLAVLAGAVPPPPEDARFIFVGMGVSVYNREMLQRNRLPLVNGFSQLITSKELAPEEEKAGATARRQPHQRSSVESAGAGDRLGAAVPTSQAAHQSGVEELRGGAQKGSAQEWEEVKREDVRDQIKAVLDFGRTRVQKQFDVSVELARIAPGKLRHAASVQVAKAQEMPGILLSTNKRMIETGSKYVRDFLAEQEKKK